MDVWVEGRSLQLEEKATQTLVNLGLTVLQAKVYIALVKSGTSTGRTTAKAAKVASQDVYRILTDLHERGLIEKIISKPNKHRPLPLKEGLQMLFQQRNKQTEELKRAAFEMSKNFLSSNILEDKNETCDFVMISNKEPFENRLKGMWETAQTSVDLMNEFQEELTEHEKIYELEIKALNKGVKIRDTLIKTQNGTKTSKSFLALLKRKPEFQARYLHCTLPAKLIIKDNKEVLISTSTKANTLAQPFLWSNNLILIQVIQQWYDIMWEKSSKE